MQLAFFVAGHSWGMPIISRFGVSRVDSAADDRGDNALGAWNWKSRWNFGPVLCVFIKSSADARQVVFINSNTSTNAQASGFDNAGYNHSLARRACIDLLPATDK